LLGVAIAVAWLTACAQTAPTCGRHSPKGPQSIRKPSFFGVISSEQSQWAQVASPHGSGELVVAHRRISVDADTERIGGCSGNNYRAAFVGVNDRGGAAWVLFACRPSPRKSGTLQTPDLTIWKVTDTSLILSEGIELPISKTLQAKLRATDHTIPTLRFILEHDDVGSLLEVDARTGQVTNASPAGCA
jgi:hypothetical protein